MSRLRSDDGTILPLIPILFAVILFMASFLYSSGVHLRNARYVDDVVFEAARTGATQTDANAFRATGAIVLDGPAATASARGVLESNGVTFVGATVAGDTITVTGQATSTGLVGWPDRQARASFTVRAEQGQS
jgi:hypothetical protein